MFCQNIYQNMGGRGGKVGGIVVGASFRVSSNKVTLSAEMENLRLIRYITWPPGYSLYKRGGNKTSWG